MTHPADPTVRVVHPQPQPTQASPEVVETAEKLVRTKKFVSKSLKNVGVPVLIGATAAFVATRRARSEDDTDTESETVTDTE